MTAFMAIGFILFGVFWIAITVPRGQWHLAAFGLIFAAAGIFLAIVGIKDIILRKRYEKNPKEYEAQFDDEYAEHLENAEEIEELEEFDADSGKGYCPHCGNYGVNSEKICESCGEKVIE